MVIDFKRAFPGMPPAKLWEKLGKMGISGKIIHIIREMYEMSAKFIRTEYTVTSKIAMILG